MPKRLLITGFDPFGGQSVNPAWEAVSRLPARVGDCVVHALQVPTVFGLAAQRVIEEAQALQPDVILCVGQAGGRAAVTPEMVAINLRYAAIPDNAGLQPQDIPCAEDGPAAYFATVPVREMARAIAQAGLPGSVSYTAGTFVCNARKAVALDKRTRYLVGFGVLLGQRQRAQVDVGKDDLTIGIQRAQRHAHRPPAAAKIQHAALQTIRQGGKQDACAAVQFTA